MRTFCSVLTVTILLSGCAYASTSTNHGVTMMIRAANTSDVPQELQIHQSLPEGVGIKDVLRHDGLELRQVAQTPTPYVYTRVMLRPRELRVYNVDIVGDKHDKLRLSSACYLQSTNAAIAEVSFRKLTPDVTITEEDGKLLLGNEAVAADQIGIRLQNIGLNRDSEILFISLRSNIGNGEELTRIHNYIVQELHKTPARIFFESGTRQIAEPSPARDGVPAAHEE